MEKETWDEILVAEHEMIERAMDILKRELDKMPQTEIDSFFLKRAIDFLLEFGDRIHNHKEEEWLFPRLVEKGIPKDGPIRVMVGEHEYERDLLFQMNNNTDAIAAMSEADKIQYKEKGLEYLETRANHIWKENDVLYAMGRKAFSDADNAFLVDAFNDFSRSIYGSDFESQIQKILNEVEKGEAARKSMIENLSYDQIDAIMETLPFEVTFVDASDAVAYFNRLDKEKIFVRTRSVIGRQVFKCHPEKSVHQVQRIVEGFKDGSLDKAEFWIELKGDKVHIRYFPVKNTRGEYMGVLEISQLIGDIQKLSGEKRLLD